MNLHFQRKIPDFNLIRLVSHPFPFLIFSGIFFETHKEQRQRLMTFKCHCIACTDNYPVIKDLPSGPISIPMPIINGLIKSYKFERQTALDNFQCVIDFLETNDKHMPCIELCSVAKYYLNIVKVIYCKEVCIEMRVDPVTQAIEISPGLQKLGHLQAIF